MITINSGGTHLVSEPPKDEIGELCERVLATPEVEWGKYYAGPDGKPLGWVIPHSSFNSFLIQVRSANLLAREVMRLRDDLGVAMDQVEAAMKRNATLRGLLRECRVLLDFIGGNPDHVKRIDEATGH